MVVVSVLVHAGALGVVVSRPAPRFVAPAQVISVELVADPSRPKHAARPRPPKPRAPRPKEIVLPARPAEPKPRPKPKPRRKEVVLDTTPKPEKSLDQLLAEMREEQGEPAPAAPREEPVQTAAVPSPGASGGTARVSPEVADWMRRAKIHVRRNWILQAGFRTQDLKTLVLVKLDASGNVVGTPEIEHRSGNPWFDESVVRGIVKASPLPPPPEPDEWEFIFTPEDSY